jgi:hypothetical protein
MFGVGEQVLRLERVGGEVVELRPFGVVAVLE